jgi:hypothetical protein
MTLPPPYFTISSPFPPNVKLGIQAKEFNLGFQWQF